MNSDLTLRTIVPTALGVLRGVLILAVASVLGILLARTGYGDPLLLQVLAILLIFVIDGPRRSGWAVVVSVLIVWYYFVPPGDSFRIAKLSDGGRLVMFMLVAGAIWALERRHNH